MQNRRHFLKICHKKHLTIIFDYKNITITITRLLGVTLMVIVYRNMSLRYYRNSEYLLTTVYQVINSAWNNFLNFHVYGRNKIDIKKQNDEYDNLINFSSSIPIFCREIPRSFTIIPITRTQHYKLYLSSLSRFFKLEQ